MLFVVFGVSGAGKTTVGRLLAERLGLEFLDADDFHSDENKTKMRFGIPLEDADRKYWLETLAGELKERSARGLGAVLACSALKKSYRETLAVQPDVKFVYLKGSFEEIAARLRNRPGHFMNPMLLQSQFDTLEEPDSKHLTFDIVDEPEHIVSEVLKVLKVE
jgi:gluconokinase